MFNKKVKEDKASLKQWLDNGLYLPPPESVKYRKIIDRKKKRKAKIAFASETYIKERNWALKRDFNKIYEINLLDKIKCDKAIVWIDYSGSIHQTISNLIDNAFNSIKAPDILIDGAKAFMQHEIHPNLWDLKQKVTSEHPGYFFHTHNNIVLISPVL